MHITITCNSKIMVCVLFIELLKLLFNFVQLLLEHRVWRSRRAKPIAIPCEYLLNQIFVTIKITFIVIELRDLMKFEQNQHSRAVVESRTSEHGLHL